MRICVLFVILLMLIVIGNTYHVFAESSDLDRKSKLELDKLDLEIINLKKGTPIHDTSTVQQIIAAAIAVILSVVTASFTWYRTKKITPFSEREKIFRELVIQRIHNEYRKEWKKIQKNILELDDKDKIKEEIKRIWGFIGKRKFPESEKIWNEHLQYVATCAIEADLLFKPKHPNLIEEESGLYDTNLKRYTRTGLIKALAETTAQSSYQIYFKIVKERLPHLVRKSVIVTTTNERLSYSVMDEEKIKSWEKDALEAIIPLMIFSSISEYEYIVRSMINVKIRELIDTSIRDLPLTKSEN